MGESVAAAARALHAGCGGFFLHGAALALHGLLGDLPLRFHVLALAGWLTLLPVGLPLGWGLVLVSQRQADGWSTRRRARELQA